MIKEIQFKLDINNLRIIRQTLLKLEYLIDIVEKEEHYINYAYDDIEMDQKKYDKQYYLERISHLFIIANMQKLQGALEKEEIELCFLAYFQYDMDTQSYKELKLEGKQVRSYEGVIDLKIHGIYLPLIQNRKEEMFEIWERYIWDGYIKESEISSIVEQDMEILIPRNKKEKETLLKLVMSYWSYKKEEFDELQSALFKELKEGKYMDINTLLVSYNLLQLFSEYDILYKIENIDELFNEVIETIKTKDLNESQKIYDDTNYNYDLDILLYKGCTIDIATQREPIKTFKEKIINIYKEKTEKGLKSEINDIVNRIHKDESKACNLMKECGRQKFLKKPSLYWLGIEKVWAILESNSLEGQLDFFTTLRRRYGLDRSENKVKWSVFEPELEIIGDLKNKYEQKHKQAEKDKDNKVIMYKRFIKKQK